MSAHLCGRSPKTPAIGVALNGLSYLAAALTLLLASDALAVELIAHRGYTCRSVENTVGAVTDAWLLRADGVELDLNVASDGVVVVFHDDNVGRRRIADMTFAEIQAATYQTVPTLASVLALGRPRGYYVLDLKAAAPGSYSGLSELLAAAKLNPAMVVIQSEYLAVLAEVRAAFPGARYHYVARLKRRLLTLGTPDADSLLASIAGHGLDGVSLKGRKAIDVDYIQRLHRADLRVFVWTINEPKRALHYQRLGVDGIITDALDELHVAITGTGAARSPCSDHEGFVKPSDSAQQ
ncbi:MAG: glycerophosphodiester phosphodiesterase family protein [Pseudomonadota bacterium]